MKKIAIFLCALVLAAAFTAVSCKKDNDGDGKKEVTPTPKEVVDAYYKAIFAKNIGTAFDCVTFESEEQKESLKNLWVSGDIDFPVSYTFLSEKINEETGTAEVKVRRKHASGAEQEQTHVLNKINGKWLITPLTK